MGRLYDIAELEASLFPEKDFEEIETDNAQINQEESEFPAEELELELENGDILTCEVVDVIFNAGHEYMMLHPTDDTEGKVHLMRMEEGEADTLILSPIKEESELQSVIEAFQKLYENEIE